jgi:2-methylisocitrate lyase-like PEP mutase family enzyme
MSATFSAFRNLHHTAALFVLPNVGDAKSARLFQENGFPAVATSSAAVAESLGYPDGEGMPFYDYLFVITRILAAVEIPLSVDLEMGYGKTDEQIYQNIKKLIDLGVAGINIEDSSIDGSGRILKDADVFAQTVAHIRTRLSEEKLELFINIRCDTFILDVDGKRRETNRRIKLYEAAGADGIFLPCINDKDDIAEVINHTKLPLNVMCVPGLPGFETLSQLGVKRASMGPFLFGKVYQDIGKLSNAISVNGSFLPLFS